MSTVSVNKEEERTNLTRKLPVLMHPHHFHEPVFVFKGPKQGVTRPYIFQSPSWTLCLPPAVQQIQYRASLGGNKKQHIQFWILLMLTKVHFYLMLVHQPDIPGNRSPALGAKERYRALGPYRAP